MLKDIFKKLEKHSDINDKICKTLLDGYVDIKAYKHDDKNNKVLVYHDTGDNTVTDWMREVIMQLLAGIPFSYNGDSNKTIYNDANHSKSINTDGTLISGDYQYLHSKLDGDSIGKYDKLQPIMIENGNKDYLYSLFPTKVLLGTNKEISGLNENDALYNKLIELYGNGNANTAAETISNLLEEVDYKYNGINKGITVNDYYDDPTVIAPGPDSYGVAGAIKTLYLPTSDDDKEGLLEAETSESGKLIVPDQRGAGKPCFIYFNRRLNDTDLDYLSQTACVSISKDSSSKYYNRITFRVIMPMQNIDEYYPYNGYTLKQIGLFNDALLENEDERNKMEYGTLLAIKNIAPFTKTADAELVFTWTLTI